MAAAAPTMVAPGKLVADTVLAIMHAPSSA